MASNVGDSADEFSSSLFEGMVLFSPSDLISSSLPPDKEPAAPSSSSSPHSKSGPLDEVFFSESKHFRSAIASPVSKPSLAAPSRLISRKKKRGFRIGYGREAADASGQEDLVASETAVSVEAATEAFRSKAEGFENDRVELMEGRLNVLRSGIYEKLEGIGEMASLVWSERKGLERRRRTGEEDVKQAWMMHKDLEKRLEAACEAEDFERAERVSESLAAAEKEKDRLLRALRDMELECDYVDLRMQEVFDLQIAAEVEGIELLEQFAKDTTERADLIHRNEEEPSSKDLEDWQTSMELLEIKKLEIDIEAKLVSDARSSLDSYLENLVKEDKDEIEGFIKKRVTLSKELDELLNLVRLKESEIAENESQIEEGERKISKVVSEFQEKSSSVDLKHDNLKSAMSRIDSERELLSSKKNQIDQFISLKEQKCFNLRDLAKIALEEAKTYQALVGLRKELASSFMKSREDKVQLTRTEERILEEIQVLRQQISSSRTKLQELSSARISVQQNIDLFKQRIAFIDKRCPELEAEKKVAAAARNFKEAGRIAAEVKTLNSEKESMQNEMDNAVLNLEKLEGDIKSKISMMQQNEELIVLKEKEAAVASFKRLKLIADAARSERSAALELGDLEEGEFLFKDAEAAEERARELQVTYGLNAEDHANTTKYFSPVVLITKFSGHRLAEMAASLKQPVADE